MSPVRQGLEGGISQALSVVIALLAVAGAAGLLASTVVARWPNYDPAAPHLLWRWRRRRVDPELTTGVALTLCVPAGVALTAAAGVLLLMVRTKTGVANYALAFARWGATHATSGSTTVLRLLSGLGGTFGVVSLAAIVGIVEYRRLPNRAI